MPSAIAREPSICFNMAESQAAAAAPAMARGDAGRLLVKPAGEIARQPLSFIGIVELPSLPQRPAYRRMQRLGQPLDHVAAFMNLAAPDRCVGAEGTTEDFAQRFGAVDNEHRQTLGSSLRSIRCISQNLI